MLSINIYHGDNTLKLIESLVYAVEKKLVVLNNEELQFVKTKLLVTNAQLNEDDLDSDVWFGKDETSSIQYIQNENNNIDKVLETIDFEMRLISGITKIPVSDFGLIDNGTGTGEKAQIIKRSAYINKIKEIRDVIEDIIRYFDEKVFIDWRDVTAEDRMTTLDVVEKAMTLGLMDKKKALQSFYGLNEQEADEFDNTITDDTTADQVNEA